MVFEYFVGEKNNFLVTSVKRHYFLLRSLGRVSAVFSKENAHALQTFLEFLAVFAFLHFKRCQILTQDVLTSFFCATVPNKCDSRDKTDFSSTQ